MNKLKFLLTMLLVAVGVNAAWAQTQVTNLSDLRADKAYTLSTGKGYISNATTGEVACVTSAAGNHGKFAFIRSGLVGNGYYIYSLDAGKFLSAKSKDADFYVDAIDGCFTINSNGNSGNFANTFFFRSSITGKRMLVTNSPFKLTTSSTWKQLDNGGDWRIIEAEDFAVPESVTAAVAAYEATAEYRTITSIGQPATDLVSGQWYLLKNSLKNAYVCMGDDGIYMRKTDNPAVNYSATDYQRYLFQIERNGDYYNIRCANGKYLSITYNAKSQPSDSPVDLVVERVGDNAGYFYIQQSDGERSCATGHTPSDNGDSFFFGWDTTPPTTTTQNTCHQFIPVELSYPTHTITDLSQLSNNKVYVIEANESKGALCYNSSMADYVYSTNRNGNTVDIDHTAPTQQWAIIQTEMGKYLYNIGANKFAYWTSTSYTNNDRYAMSPNIKYGSLTITDNTSNSTTHPWILAMENHYMNITNKYEQPVVGFWNHGDDSGCQFRIVEVGYFDYEHSAAAAAVQLYETLSADSPDTPQSNRFYRLKGGYSGNYMQANKDISDGNRYKMTADITTTPAETIWWLNESNQLISYNTGMGVINTHSQSSVEQANAGFTLSRGSLTRPYYSICSNETHTDGKYLYDGTEEIGRNNVVGTGNPGTNDDPMHCAWMLVPVDCLPVTISNAGYATLYSPVGLTVPEEGVEAFVATIDDARPDVMVLTQVDEIEAEQAVILRGAADTYNFTINNEASNGQTSVLDGCIASFRNPNEITNRFVLARGSLNGETIVGFFPTRQNEILQGFKAYFDAPAQTTTEGGQPNQVRAFTFSFDELATAIDAACSDTMADGVMYNLGGQRVMRANGLVIVNGKKVMVK